MLLFIDNIVLVRRRCGIGNRHRSLHCAQHRDQIGIFLLRLVEQYIDPDCFCAHPVEIPQSLCEQPAIERRALLQFHQRLVGINHHQDALVLLDLFGRVITAPVEQIGFRIGNPRQAPAKPGQQQRCQQQQDSQRQALRAGFPDITPTAIDE